MQSLEFTKSIKCGSLKKAAKINPTFEEKVFFLLIKQLGRIKNIMILLCSGYV